MAEVSFPKISLNFLRRGSCKQKKRASTGIWMKKQRRLRLLLTMLFDRPTVPVEKGPWPCRGLDFAIPAQARLFSPSAGSNSNQVKLSDIKQCG